MLPSIAQVQTLLLKHKVYAVLPFEEVRRTRIGRMSKDSRGDCSCVTCGLKGAFVVVHQHIGEVAKHQNGRHYDLYGIQTDGSWLMMTIDHILPRSKGGTNRSTNLQVMCATCNSRVKKNNLSQDEWRLIMRKPEWYVSTSPARRKMFAQAMIQELGININELIRRQQNVLAACEQLRVKPYWSKLFPSSGDTECAT